MKCQPLLTYTLSKNIIARWHNLKIGVFPMKKHTFWAYAAIACMVMCVWTGKAHR